MIYHYQLGFPPEFRTPMAIRSLSYTRHALREANTDGILELPRTIHPANGQLIEVNLTRQFPRYVYRFTYTPTHDIVMVMSAETPLHWTVITVWLNDVNDVHHSLDRTRYAIPA